MAKLKPCPYCGGRAEMIVLDTNEALIYCSNRKCGISTQWMKNEAAALDVWNRRENERRKNRNKSIR